MDGIIRYTAEDALASGEPGFWVRACDFDERHDQSKQRETALQDRLTEVEDRAAEQDSLLLAWYEANAKGLIQVDDAAYHIVTATAEALEGKPVSDGIDSDLIAIVAELQQRLTITKHQGEPIYQFAARMEFTKEAWTDIDKESFDEYTSRGGDWLTRIVYTEQPTPVSVVLQSKPNW